MARAKRARLASSCLSLSRLLSSSSLPPARGGAFLSGMAFSNPVRDGGATIDAARTRPAPGRNSAVVRTGRDWRIAQEGGAVPPFESMGRIWVASCHASIPAGGRAGLKCRHLPAVNPVTREPAGCQEHAVFLIDA